MDGEVAEDDIDDSNNILNGTYHLWLIDFKKNSGPKEVTGDIFERELFHLFDNLITKTNLYANQVKEKRERERERFGLVSLFNDISTFMGYLMPKPSFEKNSSDAI